MKNKKGYTLLELIITLAIVGIMTLPIYNSFIDSARVNVQAKRLVSAAYLAQNQMETIKGLTTSEFITLYDTQVGSDPVDGDLGTYDPDGYSQNTTVNYGGNQYTINTKIKKLTSEVVSSGGSITHDGNTRTADYSIRFSSYSNSHGFIKGSGTPVSFSANSNPDSTTPLPRLEIADQGGILKARVYVGSNSTYYGDYTVTGTGDITVNVNGYDGQTVDYTLEVKNGLERLVDIRTYNDDGGRITVVPTSDSTGAIRVGNAVPSEVDQDSTLEYWFEVTITISNNGATYEILQSTIGK